MRSDSDRNMSASLTRITRQVSRTFDLNYGGLLHMNKKNQYTDSVKEMLILTLAVAIIAAAVYFFLVPSHASVSSISGLGIILSNFVPLPLSAITMILNVVLLIIGFFTCGREFGSKKLSIQALCFHCFWVRLRGFFRIFTP